MPSKPAYFRITEIFDRSSNGLFSLVMSSFLLSLFSNLFALVDVLLFGGSDHWLMWSINYITIALALLSTLLVFYRRDDELIPWLVPHLRRAWQITRWQWIFVAVVVVFLLIGAHYSDSEIDQDAAQEIATNVFTVTGCVVFLPWVTIAILRLRDATMVSDQRTDA